MCAELTSRTSVRREKGLLSAGSRIPVMGFLFAAALAANRCLADWPMHMKDPARSGIASEKLSFALVRAWTYEPSQPPRPAWPEPGKEWHRLDFDYAFQPVLAGGCVYFGSSADDTVRALDCDTGKLIWRFTASGPVRFAPDIAGGKAYVASDDGWLYCLDAGTGRLAWR